MNLKHLVQRHLVSVMLVWVVVLITAAHFLTCIEHAPRTYRVIGAQGDEAVFEPVQISGLMREHIGPYGGPSDGVYDQSFSLKDGQFKQSGQFITHEQAYQNRLIDPAFLRYSTNVFSMLIPEGEFLFDRGDDYIEIWDSRDDRRRKVRLPLDVEKYSFKHSLYNETRDNSPPAGNLLVRVGSSLYGITSPQWTFKRRSVLYRIDDWFDSATAITRARTNPSGQILRPLTEPDQQELLGITAANGRPILLRGRKDSSYRNQERPEQVRYTELILEVLNHEGETIFTHCKPVVFSELYLARPAGKGLAVALLEPEGLLHHLFTVAAGEADPNATLLQDWGQIQLPRGYTDDAIGFLEEHAILLGVDRIWVLAQCALNFRDPEHLTFYHPTWWPEDLRNNSTYYYYPVLIQLAYDRTGHEVARRYLDFGALSDQAMSGNTDQSQSIRRSYVNLSLEEVTQP